MLKELIQIKLPFSDDNVIRNEIKFEINSKKSNIDASARHPLLKLLSKRDQEEMAFQLSKYSIQPKQLKPKIKLKQNRNRVYFSDNVGKSIATITVDKVQNFSFPYQDFGELELELNEILFTDADSLQKVQLEAINNNLKQSIQNKFPGLTINQTAKYNKMRALVKDSWLSSLRTNYMWIMYGGIISLALFHFVKSRLV